MFFLSDISRSRSRQRIRYTPLFAMALVVCLSLLAACGSDAVHGDEAVLTGTVSLDCNQQCKDYGSCGIAKESKNEVLLLGDKPVFPHGDAAEFKGLVDGTQVEVQETRVVTGIVQRTGEKVEIRFYLVQQETADITGWIPGFCIASSDE